MLINRIKKHDYDKSKQKIKLLLIPFILLRSILWITFVFILATACNTTEPPVITPPKPAAKDTLTITVADKTHRSITVKVTTTANGTGKEIKLIRKKEGGLDTLVSKYSVAVLDTTIIDDNNGTGLQLAANYTYYAVRIDSSGTPKDSSNFVTAQTLAATSHNYTWQQITIGDDGSSNVLYDVWGTDGNNVYAVGGFTINDTTYGVLHWNGFKWKAMLNRGGNHSIIGFSANDIWVAGGAVFHYNGSNWNPVDAKVVNNQAVILDQVLFDNREYTSVWGTSSSNLYFGNLSGKIVHWDGSKAELMDVQASEAFRDIYGLDANNIYAVAGTTAGERVGELYFNNGFNWSLIKTGSIFPTENQLIGPFYTVWVYNTNYLLTGGGRIAERIGNNWSEKGLGYFIKSIRGSKPNNVFACGFFGSVFHYNGVYWLLYGELVNTSGDMEGVYVTENNVFVVGWKGNKALILQGTKN